MTSWDKKNYVPVTQKVKLLSSTADGSLAEVLKVLRRSPFTLAQLINTKIFIWHATDSKCIFDLG